MAWPPTTHGDVRLELEGRAPANLLYVDQVGINESRRGQGRALIDYEDATVVAEAFSALPTLRTANAFQVSGNRIYDDGVSYAAGQTFIVPLPRNVTPGEKFHFSFPFTIATLLGGGGQQYFYFGFDTLAYNSGTVANNDYVLLGITASGNVENLNGSNLTATIPQIATRSGATAGNYMATLDGDENSISLFMRHTTDNSKNYGLRVAVSALTGAGKTIGRLTFAMGDNRGLTGNNVGPITSVLSSQQPSRTKIVANSISSESVVMRDMYRVGVTSSDIWRYALPSSYDPRRPAPLVLYLHQAQSSVKVEDRPWENSLERPMSQALQDAGFIVAAAQDGYTVGDNNTDRYGNDASIANITELYKYIRARYAVSSVILYGVSMGGLTAFNILARATIPNIAAVYLINPAYDLAAAYAHPSFTTPIATAYGIGGGVTYAAATEGHDPALMNAKDLRNVAIRIVAAADDPDIPESSYNPILAKFPQSPEASMTTPAGGHLSSAQFSSTDMMSFLGRHIETTI
jgi:pimeloyl-ACP methyl ester carboxylesterase